MHRLGFGAAYLLCVWGYFCFQEADVGVWRSANIDQSVPDEHTSCLDSKSDSQTVGPRPNPSLMFYCLCACTHTHTHLSFNGTAYLDKQRAFIPSDAWVRFLMGTWTSAGYNGEKRDSVFRYNSTLYINQCIISATIRFLSKHALVCVAVPSAPWLPGSIVR